MLGPVYNNKFDDTPLTKVEITIELIKELKENFISSGLYFLSQGQEISSLFTKYKNAIGKHYSK